MTGWHDDYYSGDLNAGLNYTQFVLKNLQLNVAQNALAIKNGQNVQTLVPKIKGDRMIGDSGQNTYLLGFGDTWPLQGDPTAIVWILGDKDRLTNVADTYDQSFKLAAPLDENISDPKAYPGISATQLYGLGTGIHPDGTNAFTLAEFTRGGDNSSLLFNKDGIGQLVGARTPDFLNYAPIASNKNGDFILRFKKGTVLVTSQGRMFFGISENGQSIKNGDSGIKVPVISGYEHHTDDYVIDSDQWARDALAEINKQKSQQTAELIWNINNTWLRSNLYPVIDQLGKVVNKGQPVEYSIVNFDGSVDKFTFNDYGIEVPNPNNKPNNKPPQPCC